MESHIIHLTPAALKYGNLNLSRCGKDFFPIDTIGLSSRKKGVGVPIIIKVEGLLRPIKTDIPTDNKTGKTRWLFRDRAWVKKFIKINNLGNGDKVIVNRIATREYSITINNEVSD
jgi:hypothetical protein